MCSGLNRQMHHKCIILGKILGFCPPWLLSAWILSSMGFCPHWILSPWVFVLLGFCLTWILSPWAFVPIGFCPPGFLSSLDFVRLDIVLWVFVQWDFVLEPKSTRDPHRGQVYTGPTPGTSLHGTHTGDKSTQGPHRGQVYTGPTPSNNFYNIF